MQLNGRKTFMPAVITKLQKKLGDTDGVSTLSVSAGCCFFFLISSRSSHKCLTEKNHAYFNQWPGCKADILTGKTHELQVEDDS